MSDNLELREVLAFIDTGERDLWKELSEEQQKHLKKDMFILNRYASSVKTNDNTILEYSILTTNEYYNKHWFALQGHSELLWRLLCMTSFPTKEIRQHEWIGFKKGTSNKIVKFLETVYPDMKTDELELMAKITPLDEIKYLAKDLGYTDKQLKTMLK